MILVTGATGTIGLELVEQLLEKNQQIRVFTRDERKVAHFSKPVECVVGDLSQPETLKAAMPGIERIFLVTASTQQDINVIEAAKQAGVRHIVKLSTMEASNEFLIGPGKFHREREDLIRASGLDWTFLRPTMFMSLALEWAASIKGQNRVNFPGGSGKVGAIDPWDISTTAAITLTRPGHEGQSYTLTGPELVTMDIMVQTIGRQLGRAIQYLDMADSEAAEMLRKFGLPEYVVGGLVEVFIAMREGRFAYLTNTVEQVTGSKPRPFEIWCRDHITAFQ